MKRKKIKPDWIQQASGPKKLMLAVIIAVAAYLGIQTSGLNLVTSLALTWDVFTIAMIGMSWILFLRTSAEEQHAVVEGQDDGLSVIFTLVLISVCVSMFGTLLLIMQKNAYGLSKEISTLVTLSSVAFSWLLLHTIFTIRYAHLYHDHNKLKTGSDVGGVIFPNCKAPDYLDFAYFSFVIGMTFQVSDVQVTSKMVRRYVLMHGLISFVFNTIIVALTINAIGNLSK